MGKNKRARNPPSQSLPENISKRADVCVSLRLESGSAAFVCGTEELLVPEHTAQRSELIADLLVESDGCQKDVPVQISFAEAQAWLALAAESSNTGAEDSAEAKDEKVLHALKVADFLRDPATIEGLMWQVLAVINRPLGNHGRLTRARKKPPAKLPTVPTTEECQRATQIVERIPSELLPKVIAAVNDERFRNYSQDPGSQEGKAKPLLAEHPGHGTKYLPLTRLLQLLPRTLHPAITAATCTDEEDAAALNIQPMPHCLLVPTFENGDRANGRYASATFQLLAGAAPLAGGSLEHAWCADGKERAERAAAALRGEANEEAALRELTVAEGPSSSLGASAAFGTAGTGPLLDLGCSAMTKLVLGIPGDWIRGKKNDRHADVAPEPPRWCFALAQLRALRALEITAEDPRHLHPAELGAALLQLTALESLSVTCKDAWDVPPGDVPDFPDNHPSPDFPVLHAAISRMTQLLKLALRDCYYLGPPNGEAPEELGVLVAPEFDALTRLTSLTLGGDFVHVSEGAADALIARLRCATTLQELSLQWHVSLSAEVDEDSSRLASLVHELLCLPELIGLQSLGLCGMDADREACQDACEMHTHLSVHLETRLAALTALDLSFGVTGHPNFGSMFDGMPNLRALNVACMDMEDEGMWQFAESIDFVRDLTRLDVRGNYGEVHGVLAVVNALVDAGMGRPDGLQDLDLSGNTIDAIEVEAVTEFAALLRQLVGLRVVGLPDGMGEEGLGEVVAALRELPQLRRVRVCVHADVPEAYRAGIFEPLGEVKCTFLESEVEH